MGGTCSMDGRTAHRISSEEATCMAEFKSRKIRTFKTICKDWLRIANSEYFCADGNELSGPMKGEDFLTN
jgi:hypothetical protein